MGEQNLPKTQWQRQRLPDLHTITQGMQAGAEDDIWRGPKSQAGAQGGGKTSTEGRPVQDMERPDKPSVQASLVSVFIFSGGQLSGLQRTASSTGWTRGKT